MALPVHSSLTFFPHNHHKPLLFSPRFAATSIIKSQTPSPESTPDDSSAPSSSASGVGFGSTNQRTKSGNSKTQRAAVIRRRLPLEQTNLASKPKSVRNEEERGSNENAFILTWLGLGGVILAQGLTLASSGFLPEEMDRFIVKYVYPVFTPTVGLFVAGSVAYGVVKYLQNEELKK